jgi:RNA polymerase sigma-70 factor (ECF subfamily)
MDPNAERGGATSPGPSVNAVTSFELVIRAKAGDRAALETLFSRYSVRLQRWAHGRLPPGARGALQTYDLVQETLKSAYEHLDDFSPRHEGAFQGFVRTILRNRLNDILRQFQRRGAPEVLDTALAGHETSPFEHAAFAETLARYDAALDRLRPEEKELIIARVELCLSHAEIAEQFGKPTAGAANMAVSRAMVRLAQEMADDRKR